MRRLSTPHGGSTLRDSEGREGKEGYPHQQPNLNEEHHQGSIKRVPALGFIREAKEKE